MRSEGECGVFSGDAHRFPNSELRTPNSELSSPSSHILSGAGKLARKANCAHQVLLCRVRRKLIAAVSDFARRHQTRLRVDRHPNVPLVHMVECRIGVADRLADEQIHRRNGCRDYNLGSVLAARFRHAPILDRIEIPRGSKRDDHRLATPRLRRSRIGSAGVETAKSRCCRYPTNANRSRLRPATSPAIGRLHRLPEDLVRQRGRWSCRRQGR